jgi:hypothetical protein
LADGLGDQAGVGRLDTRQLGLNITLGLLDCGLSLEFDRLTKVMESVLDVGKSLIKAWVRPSDWCGLCGLVRNCRQHRIKRHTPVNDPAG